MCRISHDELNYLEFLRILFNIFKKAGQAISGVDF